MKLKRIGFATLLTVTTTLLFSCGGSSTGVTDSTIDGSNPADNFDGGSVDGDGDGDGSNGNTDSNGDSATLTQPNFLLIITDDQGLDASAQYSLSNDLPNTPVIDQLAADGIVFDNVWATPSCTTTRGSLITGMHGVNSGVDRTPSLMDTDILTLQEHLKTGSYANAIFGKWHLAGGGNNNLSHPNESGIDHYAGNIAGVIDDYSSWPLTVNGSAEQTSTEYHTTAITDMTIDWINDQTGPWFSWVAYVAPHSPFHNPPAELHNRSLSGTAADISNNPRQYFLAAIEAMDTEIGRLLQSIPADELENTVVMVLGDNGTPRAVLDNSAFPATHGKGSLYEGGVRVPFVVSGAGVSRRSERESALVNTVDIFPTLSDAANLAVPNSIDGQSFHALLSASNTSTREFNYSEFFSDNTTGWTVRDNDYKLIEFSDGTREAYDMRSDIREENNLIAQAQLATRIAAMDTYAAQIRGTEPPAPPMSNAAFDITDVILQNTSANCADYAAAYTSNVLDVNNNQPLSGDLQIAVTGDTCQFSTNAIPNHDLNDGAANFPNPVSAQSVTYTITSNPTAAITPNRLLLTQDNAILLNGVKVDLLAAACFGVGDGRVGCNDPDQPWRFDPMFLPNGFRVDTHNAHTQPDGTYHYHGLPNALFDANDGSGASPVVGFAADGFPIFGSFFNDNGTIRKAIPSYRLKNTARPGGNGNPGGTPDGTYRDDHEFVEGLGDLDICNGMTVNGVYGYYMTEEFPYILACFTGQPDESFFK